MSGSPKYFHWTFVDASKFKSIEKYIKDEEWVWDCQNGDECTTFWVIIMNDDTPKFYRSKHSWEWERYGQEDSHLVNIFDIMEVGRDDVVGSARENLRFVI
jgi:hypothetical protein